MQERRYLIDGQPVKWFHIVDRARDLGYTEPSGIYTTSKAATVLREHGHTVEEDRRPPTDKEKSRQWHDNAIRFGESM